MSEEPHVYSGWCPICEMPARFTSRNAWYRDNLQCGTCQSIPRERALAMVLDLTYPDWRRRSIHESSPIARGISQKLRRQARRYVESQFDPSLPRGYQARGAPRNENLEDQTFASESFDLVITLDVLEHVNMPDSATREIWRTLRSGGAHIFTTPTWPEQLVSRRRAEYLPTGEIKHLAEPEYHGGASGEPSLVTFTFGLDLPELIYSWAPFDVTAFRFADVTHGILGAMTDVYLCRKR